MEGKRNAYHFSKEIFIPWDIFRRSAAGLLARLLGKQGAKDIMFLPETLLVRFCSIVRDFKHKSIIFISIYTNTPGRKCPRIGAYHRKSSHSFDPSYYPLWRPPQKNVRRNREPGDPHSWKTIITLRELEKRCALKVLQETGGNKKRHPRFWALIEQRYIKY